MACRLKSFMAVKGAYSSPAYTSREILPIIRFLFHFLHACTSRNSSGKLASTREGTIRRTAWVEDCFYKLLDL